MLPQHLRLRSPEDFRRVVRSGRRLSTPTLVVHAQLVDQSTGAGDEPLPCPRIGVTVSKAVGGSVVRHRVARQIRHAVARDIELFPAGSRWVFRALPTAGDPSSPSQVSEDVASGVRSLLVKASEQ